MPVVENEAQTDADYICDFCGEKIENEAGHCCTVCQRIICVECSQDHPISNVLFNDHDTHRRKSEYMCDVCRRAWLKLRPKQVKLEEFGRS